MAFKPLDMQMSIPRTQDVGVLQSQAAHRPIVEQNLLANQTEKETEQKRTQSSELEKAAKAEVHTNDQGKSSYQGRSASKRRSSDTEEQTDAPAHPYKGHNLDISL